MSEAGPKRVALDVNVWSYLAAQGTAAGAGALCDSVGARLVVPPASILEAARTKDAIQRTTLLHALGDPRLEHVSTEAASEAAELVQAATARRPQWMRRIADLGELNRLEAFWTRRLPRAARTGEPWLAERAHDDVQSRALVRSQVLANKKKRGKVSLSAALHHWVVRVADVTDSDLLPGWPSASSVAAWRIDNCSFWWHQLVDRVAQAQLAVVAHGLAREVAPPFDTTMADWALARLRRERLSESREDWNRFWYGEVSEEEMARNWVRWAIALAQADFKVGAGSGVGGDQQLSSYLVDLDFFITADRAFARALQVVAAHAPCPFAEVLIIGHDEEDQLGAIRTVLSGAETLRRC